MKRERERERESLISCCTALNIIPPSLKTESRAVGP